jgi:hypothetical protein
VNKLRAMLTQDGHKCNCFDAIYLKKINFLTPLVFLCQNRAIFNSFAPR